MKIVPACDQGEALVDYLYGEGDEAARTRFETHLAGCGECRRGVEALAGVRRQLAVWEPPDASLGFRVVKDPAPLSRRLRQLGIAAGFLLALGGALALANLEVRYGQDGVSLRTGWSAPPASEVGAPERQGAPWEEDLAALERRLRGQIEVSRTTVAEAPAVAPPVRSDADIMRRVQALVRESEARQQRELRLRLSEVIRDVETQRRTDLARIERGLGQLEGMTGAEAARQREVLNYLVRVSQRR